jgi:hypothetical protein
MNHAWPEAETDIGLIIAYNTQKFVSDVQKSGGY